MEGLAIINGGLILQGLDVCARHKFGTQRNLLHAWGFWVRVEGDCHGSPHLRESICCGQNGCKKTLRSAPKPLGGSINARATIKPFYFLFHVILHYRGII